MKLWKRCIDWDSTNKATFLHVFYKIVSCHFSRIVHCTYSLNGYHVTLFCIKNCLICYLCHCDYKYIMMDEKRPVYMRNVLFQGHKKLYVFENGELNAV